MNAFVEAAGLAALATVNVGLWTLRVALAAAGRRAVASLTAGTEALLFAVTFGTVVTGLDNPVRVGGYAVGVAAGTLVGIVVHERLSSGPSAEPPPCNRPVSPRRGPRSRRGSARGRPAA